MIKSLKRLINNLDVQLIKFALILEKLQNLTNNSLCKTKIFKIYYIRKMMIA